MKPIVRCQACKLNQFLQDACRRCHKPLQPPVALVAAPPVKPACTPADTLAQRVRQQRLSRKLSQRQLAEIMDCPRQYLVKVESAKVTPGPQMVRRLAEALQCPLDELVPRVKSSRPDSYMEFMGEIASLTRLLTAEQRSCVLIEAKRLAWRHGGFGAGVSQIDAQEALG